MRKSEIKKWFVECEFDDECGYCDDPTGVSWAVGYTNDECGIEVDSYVCSKCAPALIEKQKEENRKFDEYIQEQQKLGLIP